MSEQPQLAQGGLTVNGIWYPDVLFEVFQNDAYSDLYITKRNWDHRGRR